MVTNLPAEAKAAWAKVMEAKTPEEKLKALQEFLSKVPKHKGTENLVRWVRRRIAQLKREIEMRKIKERSIRSGSGRKLLIEKEGDVQLVVAGPPMSGKTSLLKCLTNAKVEPDDIPYSNTEPIPGMFIYEEIYYQLIKAPSINLEDYDSDMNIINAALMRNADGILLILDASDTSIDPISQFNRIYEILKTQGIYLTKPKALVKIEKRNIPGIQIIGKIVNTDIEQVKRLLIDYGIQGAVVHIEGEATLEDIEDSIFREYVYRPCILIINKIDLVDEEYVKYIVDNLRSKNLPIILTSLKYCKIDKKELSEKILKTLELIRVYTKEPGEETYSTKPFIVKKGTTVGDLARRIHSYLYEHFKYAKIWKKDQYPQMFKRVGINYELQDGDIVEIHA